MPLSRKVGRVSNWKPLMDKANLEEIVGAIHQALLMMEIPLVVGEGATRIDVATLPQCQGIDPSDLGMALSGISDEALSFSVGRVTTKLANFPTSVAI